MYFHDNTLLLFPLKKDSYYLTSIQNFQLVVTFLYADSSEEKCPSCGSTNLLYMDDVGLLVCGDCGLVIEEDFISNEMERRFFKPLEKISLRRTTSSRDLSTLFARQSFLAVKPSQSTDKYALLESSYERNLKKCNSYLTEYCDKLRLPNIIRKEALRIISQYAVRKSISEKDAPIAATVAIFIATRNSGYHKPLDKILKTLGIPKKSFSRVYRSFREILNIHVQPPDPEKYTIAFGNELHLSQECIKTALNIVKKIKLSGKMLGKDAAGLAAAAIYYASLLTGEKRTQRRIAEIAAITETTIKNRFRELITLLNMQ